MYAWATLGAAQGSILQSKQPTDCPSSLAKRVYLGRLTQLTMEVKVGEEQKFGICNNFAVRCKGTTAD